jgi:MFS family permease
LLLTLAIMSLSTGGNAVNPVLQRIIEAFPGSAVSAIRLIATLPSLAGMAGGLLVGAVVGKRVRFRTISIIGIVLFILSGAAPALFHQSLGLVLFFRFVFGLALACLGSRGAYILSQVPDKTAQAKLVGAGQVAGGLGGVVLQLSCGYLADISWPLAFFPYLLGIIPLVLVLLIRESEPVLPGRVKTQAESPGGSAQTTPGGSTRTAPEDGGRMGTRFILYSVLLFLVMANAFPVMTGMSTLITGRNLGNASVTAVILALCQSGSIAAGLMFGFYYKKLKRLAIPLAMFFQGLGVFFVFISRSLILISIGAVISGIATILLLLLFTTYGGQSTGKRFIPLTVSIIGVAAQVGMFGSGYYIQFADWLFRDFFSSDVERCYLLGSIVFALLTVVSLVFNLSPREEKPE